MAIAPRSCLGICHRLELLCLLAESARSGQLRKDIDQSVAATTPFGVGGCRTQSCVHFINFGLSDMVSRLAEDGMLGSV